jgi:uncharacterized damage-inducible protein DinB
MSSQLAEAFVNQAIRHLEEDFMPKIRACLEELSEDEVWWRPNAQSNSVGNMLLHLSGNVQQWILAGVGRATDTRQRQKEFDARGPIAKGDLLKNLEEKVRDAKAVLQKVDEAELLSTRHIQAYDDVTVLEAVFHVVEHFSYHTGQIVYVTKLLKESDLQFYSL